MRAILAAISLVLILAVPARADVGSQWDVLASQATPSGHDAYARGSVIGGRPAACHRFPKTARRYCGCASALKVGLDNRDGRWNLARNWYKFPRAAPGPGMADVRRNHVRIIIGGRPGAWVFYDPNSGGGLTRIVTGPVKGTVVNPHGARYAQAR